MTGITRRMAALTLTAGAAASCVDGGRGPTYGGKLSFRHGVASGDALSDRVVIWTRISPEGPDPVPVRWVVARDEGLNTVVRDGEATAQIESDFTVKVDVDGLSPGQRYFYGFMVGGLRSPVGRTRTAPSTGVAEIKLAAVSCASFSHGFFNAYEALAQRDDVDFVIHLGDYLYESGLSGYGGEEAIALGRLPRPDVECLTLEDYRTRHAQYKQERELQAAHAAFAWYVIFDDHEVADDAYLDGAANHQPLDGDGDWGARRRAALQAYYEWMPIRDPVAGRSREQAWRSVDLGDLATLIILETRYSGRSRPLSYESDLKPISAVWDFANPEVPQLLAAGAIAPATARVVPTPFDVSSNPPTPITDWRRIRAIDPEKPPFGIAFLPDLDALKARLANPERTLMGLEQEAWVAKEVVRSRTKGAPWQIFANQTLMARINAPDISRRLGPEAVAALEKQAPGAQKLLDLTQFRPPLSLDSWDGYPAARTRFLAALAQTDANALILTGDSHAAWVTEIYSDDKQTRLAAEFATTSVTSPGLGDLLKNAPFDFAQLLVESNAGVVWTEQVKRGFLLLTVRREEAFAEFIVVSSVTSKDYDIGMDARFRVAASAGAGIGKPEPAPER